MLGMWRDRGCGLNWWLVRVRDFIGKWIDFKTLFMFGRDLASGFISN